MKLCKISAFYKDIKYWNVFCFFITCLFNQAFGQGIKTSPSFVAFTNVNIIAMDSDQILTNQTVITKDNIIEVIGANVQIPKSARIIKGKGKFLIPGLIDMHPHLPESENINHRKYFLMNLLAGVTSLRLMRGNELQLKYRDSISNHSLIGPQLFVSKVIRDEMKTSINIRDSIRNFKLVGYDFIKILCHDAKLCDSIIKNSNDFNLKVAGHVPYNDLPTAIRLKQNSIEHIEALIQSYFSDSLNFEKNLQLVRENNVYLCPDVYWYFVNWKKIPLVDLKQSTGIQFLKPALIKEWEKEYVTRNISAKLSQRFSSHLKATERILQMAQKNNIKLLAGSGDGLFIVPGYSLHKEIEVLVKMGITPFNALKGATYSASQFFGKETIFGSIAIGRRADLVLLGANPLLNIQNLAQINGVMVNGQWLPVEKIKKMLNNK